MYVALGGVVSWQIGVVWELSFFMWRDIINRNQNVLTCSFVRFICSDNLPTLGLVDWSHVAESC